MSMAVYPVTGEPLTLIKSDNTRASGIVAETQGGIPEGGPMHGAQVEVTQDRSTTSNGTVRCMVKVTARVPYENNAGYNDTNAVGTISAHTVVTIPKAVADRLVLESTGTAVSNSCEQGITWILRVLAALTYGKSIAGQMVAWNSLNIPMLLGVEGALPLNLDSGSYGSAS